MVPFHAYSELALPTVSRDLQLQLLSAERRALCNWGARVLSQVPRLRERACLLEKVGLIFPSSTPKSDIHFCILIKRSKSEEWSYGGQEGAGIN